MPYILYLCFSILFCLLSILCYAQQKLAVKVTDAEKKSGIPATIIIQQTRTGSTADSNGNAIIDFPFNGNFTLVTTAVGFARKEMKVYIPYITETIWIEMTAEEEELEEVIVQTTRTSRTIQNEPTRVEIIEAEEIDEKNNMRPANVAMLLHESTGIQVQQTSATSGNSSVRIQGLDGRYTQLLKDGFANFGNFSSGLSVLEIPPLDLRQVEIIKGPASTLYGGGAIAGVINFISKTPKAAPEYKFILNQSNIGQTNVGGFASKRGEVLGYTLLATYNNQKLYDVDDDDFTELPDAEGFTFHPKIFFYPNENTIIELGNSFSKNKRTGGDVHVIKGKPDASHQYFEKNATIRNISTFELNRQFNNNRLIARQSFNYFDRSINIPVYSFAGVSYNAFTDVAYIMNRGNNDLVIGGNFIYDDFNEKDQSADNRDNKNKTAGLYAQHTWDATNNVQLESGLRFDLANYENSVYSNTEFFVLPRLSLLIKFTPQITSRISAGMGYKTPTLFTEESETIQYRNIAQLDNVKSEKSYGGTADVNFSTAISGDLVMSFNHMFFYTSIQKPLVLSESFGNYFFRNMDQPVRSFGTETNAKFIVRDNFKLFLGYTFTNAKAKYLSGNQFLPLVPKSKLNTALIYEKEDVIKLGLEGYFTGRQYLSNGIRTPAFEELGFMAEKIFEKFSLYINFENFTDTKQSSYKRVVNGSPLNPVFDEIWTHTEGFIVNGGIKVRL